VANPIFRASPDSCDNWPFPPRCMCHFNGAGGNIGAGKYNDGAPTNRGLSPTARLGHGTSLGNGRRIAVSQPTVGWTTEQVSLPPSRHLSSDLLEKRSSGTRIPHF